MPCAQVLDLLASIAAVNPLFQNCVYVIRATRKMTMKVRTRFSASNGPPDFPTLPFAAKPIICRLGRRCPIVLHSQFGLGAELAWLSPLRHSFMNAAA